MPFSENQRLRSLKVWKRVGLGFRFLFICFKKEVTSKVLSVSQQLR